MRWESSSRSDAVEFEQIVCYDSSRVSGGTVSIAEMWFAVGTAEEGSVETDKGQRLLCGGSTSRFRSVHGFVVAYGMKVSHARGICGSRCASAGGTAARGTTVIPPTCTYGTVALSLGGRAAFSVAS